MSFPLLTIVLAITVTLLALIPTMLDRESEY
jgi:hypothetical protein